MCDFMCLFDIKVKTDMFVKHGLSLDSHKFTNILGVVFWFFFSICFDIQVKFGMSLISFRISPH